MFSLTTGNGNWSDYANVCFKLAAYNRVPGEPLNSRKEWALFQPRNDSSADAYGSRIVSITPLATCPKHTEWGQYHVSGGENHLRTTGVPNRIRRWSQVTWPRFWDRDEFPSAWNFLRPGQSQAKEDGGPPSSSILHLEDNGPRSPLCKFPQHLLSTHNLLTPGILMVKAATRNSTLSKAVSWGAISSVKTKKMDSQSG